MSPDASASKTVYLSDYTPYPYKITSVALTFRLDPAATRVVSVLALEPVVKGADLALDGEGLKLISVAVDGASLPEAQQAVSAAGLVLSGLPEAPFTLTIETEIAPKDNTALEGLLCRTACIAPSARPRASASITYLPGPARMSCRTFTVRINGPINRSCFRTATRWSRGAWLGGNGTTPGPNPPICSRWWRETLICHRDSFTTASRPPGRSSPSVRPSRARRAKLRLSPWTRSRRSMLWDEERLWPGIRSRCLQHRRRGRFQHGRDGEQGPQYLQLLRCVLASPETATDRKFENGSRPLSRTNISTTGRETELPAATGSNCA